MTPKGEARTDERESAILQAAYAYADACLDDRKQGSESLAALRKLQEAVVAALAQSRTPEPAPTFRDRLIREFCSKYSGAQLVVAGDVLDWIMTLESNSGSTQRAAIQDPGALIAAAIHWWKADTTDADEAMRAAVEAYLDGFVVASSVPSASGDPPSSVSSEPPEVTGNKVVYFGHPTERSRESPEAAGERIWTCKIGGACGDLPPAADAPMRNAVANAFHDITGGWPDFIFSGWGGWLDEGERAVVENRRPRPAATDSPLTSEPDETTKVEQSGGGGVPEPLTDALRDVKAERERQQSAEGWTPKHDDEHAEGEMALAASVYADPNPSLFDPVISRAPCPKRWPWDASEWKPKDRRRNLIRAGALILAEIERLDRRALGAVPLDALKEKK